MKKIIFILFFIISLLNAYDKDNKDNKYKSKYNDNNTKYNVSKKEYYIYENYKKNITELINKSNNILKYLNILYYKEGNYNIIYHKISKNIYELGYIYSTIYMYNKNKYFENKKSFDIFNKNVLLLLQEYRVNKKYNIKKDKQFLYLKILNNRIKKSLFSYKIKIKSWI